MLKDKIQQLEIEINALTINTSDALESFRLRFLSKKGELALLFSDLKSMDPAVKKEVGAAINQLKQKAESLFESHKHLAHKPINSFLEDPFISGIGIEFGGRHPLTIIQDQIIEIFQRLGFALSQGPEIEDDWHNFSALNFPPEHPARDMQDTFFIDGIHALRTHTSSVQVRLMDQIKPPMRFIMPGRVYRNEAVSARANCFFHQVEGIYIDKNVSFADLKLVLFEFAKQMFGADVTLRFRPSYFPFTEPSAEMDISCFICGGNGCNICKHSGWVEILGCGMIDPAVLENNQIDSEVYSGYAFGMGIERITMLKYQFNDLRLFFDNDLRMLRQFS